MKREAKNRKIASSAGIPCNLNRDISGIGPGHYLKNVEDRLNLI